MFSNVREIVQKVKVFGLICPFDNGKGFELFIVLQKITIVNFHSLAHKQSLLDPILLIHAFVKHPTAWSHALILLILTKFLALKKLCTSKLDIREKEHVLNQVLNGCKAKLFEKSYEIYYKLFIQCLDLWGTGAL